jgi:hypothetical protein
MWQLYSTFLGNPSIDEYKRYFLLMVLLPHNGSVVFQTEVWVLILLASYKFIAMFELFFINISLTIIVLFPVGSIYEIASSGIRNSSDTKPSLLDVKYLR